MTHDELVLIAEKWLTNIGCGVTFAELTTACPETPDAIGWKQTTSVLVEAKASRADFHADKNKSFRAYPDQGLGCWRFYLTPELLILPHELPAGWGLLYATGNGVRRVHGVPASPGDWHRNHPFKANRDHEMILLLSALRRLKLRGRLPEIYQPLAPGFTTP